MYEIVYHSKVLSHDLVKIPKADLLSIHGAIERKLRERPEIYGAHLRGELRSYFKLRIGDYRVLYKFSGKSIYILRVAHRKNVYRLPPYKID